MSNIQDLPLEGNFHSEQGKMIMLEIVVVSSYLISRQIWKWTKKLFFQLYDLDVANSYILFSSCDGDKISHRDFHFISWRNMLAVAGREEQLQRPVGRPPTASASVVIQGTSFNKDWPIPSKARALSCVLHERCDFVKYLCNIS